MHHLACHHRCFKKYLCWKYLFQTQQRCPVALISCCVSLAQTPETAFRCNIQRCFLVFCAKSNRCIYLCPCSYAAIKIAGRDSQPLYTEPLVYNGRCSVMNISEHSQYSDTKRFLVSQDWCSTDPFVLPIRTLPYFPTQLEGVTVLVLYLLMMDGKVRAWTNIEISYKFLLVNLRCMVGCTQRSQLGCSFD